MVLRVNDVYPQRGESAEDWPALGERMEGKGLHCW